MKQPTEGVKKLIFEYFNTDVLEPTHGLSNGIRQNIIKTFTYAYNRHLTKKQVVLELEGTNMSELRDRLRSNNKPFPVRWGDLKPKLQQEAVEKNTSMHSLCKLIVERYYKNKEALI